MIDFEKKILNSDKFRTPALTFQRTGVYCLAPKGSSEYVKYWNEEKKRCLEGYTADDGDYITGYNYFYLNYCPIVRQVWKVITDRNGNLKKIRTDEREFPDFYDYDYFYFLAIDAAEIAGKHLCVGKSRRKGYSYKGGSMLCRNFFLIPNSKSYVYASKKQYLTDDGILTKAWDYMDFIDEHTAFAKKRQVANTAMRRRASFITTDEYGNRIEQGYKSEIIGLSLKDNPDIVRGKKAKLILFEEAGSFSELLIAWQVARPSVEHDGYATGLMIMFGTGGDEGPAVSALKGAFYKPEEFGCLGFKNIWDDEPSDRLCGFFVPQHTNLDIRDEFGNRIYMDKDGNTNHVLAKKYILDLREQETKDSSNTKFVDRYIAEHAETPTEAFTEFSGNIFPKKELQNHLARIRTNKKLSNHKQVGELTWVNGVIDWTQKKGGDLRTYKLSKEDDRAGAIVIWEHPVKDAPAGLYIAGCLTPGEKVLTKNGLTNVEDVTLDDQLVSRNGNFVDIVNLQRYLKKDENIFTLKPFGSYRTTTFTGEHPILLQDGNFVKASELKVNDTLTIPNRYHKTSDEFVKKLKHYLGNDFDIFDKDFWWFLGAWLGDGFNNLNRNSHDIYCAFGKNQIIEAFEYDKIIKKIFDRKNVWCKWNGGQTRRFTHKQLFMLLSEEFGKYANGKRIPEWVKLAPYYLRKHFILGYLDSDGSAFMDRGRLRVNFTSINLELLEDLQDMLYGVDVCSSITKHSDENICKFNNKVYISQQTYRLSILSKDIQIFIKDTDNDRLSRKYLTILQNYRSMIKQTGEKAVVSSCGNYIFLKIDKIETSKYTGWVYNFECDTHTYMTRNIVTHNCDPLTKISGFV